MTGFGAGRGQAAGEAVSVELRSVNGKFCEVKPRLPRELSTLEPELVKAVKARVNRGVVEVFDKFCAHSVAIGFFRCTEDCGRVVRGRDPAGIVAGKA